MSFTDIDLARLIALAVLLLAAHGVGALSCRGAGHRVSEVKPIGVALQDPFVSAFCGRATGQASHTRRRRAGADLRRRRRATTRLNADPAGTRCPV
jgi:hypothetical protein